jgi:ribonuclease-3
MAPPEEFLALLKSIFLPAHEALLRTALTHRSWVNEHPGHRDYERLEFLGDAVLDLVISARLYQALPDAGEGVLTAKRSEIVNESAMAAAASRVNLGALIFLGRGEQQNEGQRKPKILCSALEALLGAAHLVSGMEAVERLMHVCLDADVLRAVANPLPTDNPVDELQRYAQKSTTALPEYKRVSRQGPDHLPLFTWKVSWGQETCTGQGGNQQQAKANAARGLLQKLLKQ